MTNEIGRVLTAMVTPFDESGAVDCDALGDLAQRLLDSGSDGLVITGTTGESPALSIEEQVEVWRAVRAAVGPRGPVVAGASTNSTSESLEMVTQGAGAGMDALMLTVPYYNKPPQAGLVRHFTTLAEATPLPCILYNIPSRTSLNMTAETTLRLAREVPNIVGIKEASGDVDQVRAIVEGAPEGFHVWSGDDSAARWMVEMGCYGVISVASHLVGKQISALIAAAAEGRAHDAAELEERLMPLFDVLFVETNPIPVKFALNQLGIRAGDPRLPLVPPSAAAQEMIRAELTRHRMDIAVPV